MHLALERRGRYPTAVETRCADPANCGPPTSIIYQSKRVYKQLRSTSFVAIESESSALSGGAVDDKSGGTVPYFSRE